MASDAVNGGHVHINNQRCKASKPVQIDDEVRIKKSGIQFTVLVKALSDKRGAAPQAALLYSETEESINNRELTSMQRKVNVMANPHPTRKPDKRQRRQLKAWQDKS